MAAISIRVSEQMLESLQRRATRQSKSLEHEAAELLAVGLLTADSKVDDLDAQLQSLELMTDDDLLNAARSRLSRRLSLELEKLHQKQQREGISGEERHRSQDLTVQFERCLAIRARAIELLHTRGHDVSQFLQS